MPAPLSIPHLPSAARDAENFDSSSAAFVDALCECLPELSRDEVLWRFHFLLGTIYYTASGPHRIKAFSEGRCDPADLSENLKHLIPFLAAGFRAPAGQPRSQPDLRLIPKTGEHE
jgi:Tetracyclin repressor-like, C-terminal domain